MVASVFAGYWGDLMGWRYAFYVPAITVLLIWILFVFFQRNSPEDVRLPPIETYHGEETTVFVDTQSERIPPSKGSWELVKQVLANRMVLVMCLAYFLSKPTRYAILFWGPKYIQEKLGSRMAESGALSALFELAGIVGDIPVGVGRLAGNSCCVGRFIPFHRDTRFRTRHDSEWLRRNRLWYQEGRGDCSGVH